MSHPPSAVGATRAPSTVEKNAVPSVSLYGGTNTSNGGPPPHHHPPGPHHIQDWSSANLSINNQSPLQHSNGHTSNIAVNAANAAQVEALNLLNMERQKVGQLLEQVRVHEGVIHDQTLTLERMKEDYRHNLRVLESRDTELADSVQQRDSAERQVTEVQTDLNMTEGKVEALRGALEEAETAYNENTKAVREELDAHKARVSVLLAEKADYQKSISELEMEIAQLREDAQHQRAQYTRQLEAEKRKFQQECEEAVEEQHRATLSKEEQMHSDRKRLETRNTEIHSELSRLKDTMLSTEMQREEYQKLAAGRESTIGHVQQQLNDLRRAGKQREADLETEIATLRNAREQAERNSATHGVTISRDLDKKVHELELLEQKMSALRIQQEAELKRKNELHLDTVKGLEDKLYVADQKLRQLDTTTSSQSDECERLKRQAAELKKDNDAQQAHNLITSQTMEDLERGVKRRDLLLEKAHADVKKLTQLLHEKEKEVNVTRTEISRRESHDRAHQEKVLSLKERKWQKDFHGNQQPYGEEFAEEEEEEMALQDRSAASGFGAVRRPVDFNPSLMASPVAADMDVSARSSRTNSRSRSNSQKHHSAADRAQQHQQDLTIDLLHDIKGQLANQKDSTMLAAAPAAMAAVNTSSGINRSNVSMTGGMGPVQMGGDYYTAMDQSHAASRATTAQLRRELAAMRENHTSDREELEEKLAGAVNDISKERKRTERLQAQVQNATSSQQSSFISSQHGGDTSTAAPLNTSSGSAMRAPSVGGNSLHNSPQNLAHAQRLENLRQQFSQPPVL